ncbi:MAG: alpha-ribazole phosphatase [Chloroflexota bacterium]
MKILLIRHGQTDWNLNHRFQGHSDVPLNETGRRQAGQLAERLTSFNFDAVYSSDLSRAQETAEIIAVSHQLPVTTDLRWRELSFGKWEGLMYPEIQLEARDLLAQWETDPEHIPPPDGETLGQLAARVGFGMSALLAKHEQDTVVLVAHGGSLQVLICLALRLSPSNYWKFSLSPASISEIACHPAGAILNSLNDTNHL